MANTARSCLHHNSYHDNVMLMLILYIYIHILYICIFTVYIYIYIYNGWALCMLYRKVVLCLAIYNDSNMYSKIVGIATTVNDIKIRDVPDSDFAG